MKSKFYLILPVMLIGFLSCKKEGCIDSDAVNFNAEATDDDGSCKYESTVTFWFDNQTANDLYNSGVDYLDVYVDNEYIGTENVNNPWSGEPECAQSTSTFKTKEMTESANTYGYECIDQNGSVVYNGNWLAKANECLIVELN